jgi:hypothetical protein
MVNNKNKCINYWNCHRNMKGQLKKKKVQEEGSKWTLVVKKEPFNFSHPSLITLFI